MENQRRVFGRWHTYEPNETDSRNGKDELRGHRYLFESGPCLRRCFEEDARNESDVSPRIETGRRWPLQVRVDSCGTLMAAIRCGNSISGMLAL